MPLGQKEGALIGTGTGLVAATVYFYRRKQTLPFKVSVTVWLQPWALAVAGPVWLVLTRHARCHESLALPCVCRHRCDWMQIQVAIQVVEILP